MSHAGGMGCRVPGQGVCWRNPGEWRRWRVPGECPAKKKLKEEELPMSGGRRGRGGIRLAVFIDRGSKTTSKTPCRQSLVRETADFLLLFYMTH